MLPPFKKNSRHDNGKNKRSHGNGQGMKTRRLGIGCNSPAHPLRQFEVLVFADFGRSRISLQLSRRQFVSRNKSRRIVPGVNHNAEGVPCSFAFVILLQLPPKPVDFNPHDGVSVLVEIRCSSQGFRGQIVFFDSVGPTQEVLVANVFEQLGLPRGFGEDARTENILELTPLVVVVSQHRHIRRPEAKNWHKDITKRH